MTHVELIKPTEKLGPELGGTGYLPPSRATPLPELAKAIHAGQIVWKVARRSVNWRRPARTRLLDLGVVKVRCAVIGSMKDWYFVQVLG